MNQEQIDLVIARVRGFVYELGAVLLTGVLGFIAEFFGSDAFSELVTRHFGTTMLATITFFVASAIVKHIRNLNVIGSWKRMGARGPVQHPELI